MDRGGAHDFEAYDWSAAVREIEDGPARLEALGAGRAELHCMCGKRVADEVELRVHRHYDHAEAIAA